MASLYNGMTAEEFLAWKFHEARESLAPGFTNTPKSPTTWEGLSPQDKNLLIATCRWLFTSGVIRLVSTEERRQTLKKQGNEAVFEMYGSHVPPTVQGQAERNQEER